MGHMSTLSLSIGLCLAVCASAARSAPVASATLETRAPAVLVDISNVRRAAIDRLKLAAGAGWWLELGDALLVVGNLADVRAQLSGATVRELGVLAPDDLVLHARGCGETTLAPSPMLHTGLSYELMRQSASTRSAPQLHASHLGAAEWLPVLPNTVLAQRFEPGFGGVEPADPYIQPIVSSVSPARWFADVEALASFDRSSYSAELSAARGYIAQQFAALGLAIEEPQFQFTYNGNGFPQPATVRNVIGRWTGTRTPSDLIVVGGHYDSRNSINAAPLDTPGADDNASGCSGVMEAARALTRYRPESTIIFMCYAGEEQGLHGSIAHVNFLRNAGDLVRVSHMANMDMIGWSATPNVGVLIGTTNFAPNIAVMQQLAGAAATYAPELEVMTTTSTCCSDHMPYLAANGAGNPGRPAVFSIHRGSASAYPNYHQSSDLPVNLGAHAQLVGGAIIRMNVAALARWSGASDLVFADSFVD